MVAASWLDNEDGARIAVAGLEQPYDKWMTKAYEAALGELRTHIQELSLKNQLQIASNSRTHAFLQGKFRFDKEREKEVPEPKLPPAELELFRHGKEVFNREAHCVTCHGDGKSASVERVHAR